MGLFSNIANVASLGLVGKGPIDGLLGMGGSSSGAYQFNPDFSQSKADIDKIRALRDSEIKDIRESAKLQLKGLTDSRDLALGDMAKAGAGRFQTIANQAALTGGLQGGAASRIGRATAKQGMSDTQRMLSDFAARETGIRASDIAAQEALRNQALFASPSLSLGMDQIGAETAAANAQAQAMAKAQRAGRFSQIGSLLGAGAGFALGGGPLGASVGSGIGSSFGGLLGG